MLVTGNKSLLNYSLSIRHRADGFSFYVQSTGSGKVILREEIKLQEGEEAHAALERGLRSKRISGYSYERVNMLVATPSTRLPLDEFRRDDMLAVYRTAYHGTTAKREDIKFQVLPTLEVVELFTLSPQIETTLHQHNQIFIIQLKQGRLTYANTFQATLPEDQLYFLLYIWKLFNLDAHHDICTLYNTTKELLPLVRDFIVNVQTKTIPL